jgi:hypothetical protein
MSLEKTGYDWKMHVLDAHNSLADVQFKMFII